MLAALQSGDISTVVTEFSNFEANASGFQSDKASAAGLASGSASPSGVSVTASPTSLPLGSTFSTTV